MTNSSSAPASAPNDPAPGGQALIEKVLAAESGARDPQGWTKLLIVNLAVLWSIFQL